MVKSPATSQPAPLNWPVALMFIVTAIAAAILVPTWGILHGYSRWAWVSLVVLLSMTEMAITCGYHRLFSHGAYQARTPLKIYYVLVGAMALQNSILVWCAGHRVHHRYIDDPDRDPYCAKRGLWFSHLGWMVRNYPSGETDYTVVRDLASDPLIAWQDRHYLPLAIGLNIGVPLALGWLVGDTIGVFLMGGLLRLVLCHHFTFLINSAAHAFGTQPYTTTSTARDNHLLAVLTFGEGYHNYHHFFASDYRNGVRWWHWDPSKWFIRAMSFLGLAHRLRRVPKLRIQRALLETQFERARNDLAARGEAAQFGALGEHLREEYATFQALVAKANALREQALDSARETVAARWETLQWRTRSRELESALRLQLNRITRLRAQIA